MMQPIPPVLTQLAKKLEAKHKKDGYVGTTACAPCPLCPSKMMHYYHSYHKGVEWFECSKCGFFDMSGFTIQRKARRK
jgi:hypothetical protein